MKYKHKEYDIKTEKSDQKIAGHTIVTAGRSYWYDDQVAP